MSRKSVVLKSMEVSNFKGLKSFKTEFGPTTTIAGMNGTCKSTVYDAFLWLLFGKNAEDEKDFYIKNTVDTTLNRQDHRVAAILMVGGEEVKLERIYKEKWVKKRGSETDEFAGHITSFFYNDVPLDQGPYNEKISAIIGEDIFKLLTNVYYFNNLSWQVMRATITKIATVSTDEEIASKSEDFQKLLRALSGKNYEEYKKELAARLKKSKEEFEKIPVQIAEALSAKVIVDELNDETRLQTIKDQIATLQQKKDSITESNKPIFEKINKENTELSELKVQLSNAKLSRQNSGSSEKAKAESEYNTKKAVIDGEISTINAEIKNTEDEIKRATDDIATKNESLTKRKAAKEELLSRWKSTNAEKEPTIDEKDCSCPTCNRRFDEGDIQSKIKEMLEKWNTNRAATLKQIDIDGNKLKNEITVLETELAQLLLDVGLLQEKLKEQKSRLTQKQSELSLLKPVEVASSQTDTPSDEEVRLQKLIDNFKTTPVPTVDFTEIDKEIADLQKQNDEVVSAKASVELNKKQDARVEELKAKEKTLAKEIASIEKTQFVMAEFTKAKMDEVEKSINSMFTHTTFKMFEAQINGGEKETCIAMYKGVPYSSVNFAGKINCGLDVINTLVKHYGISAPVFIDNIESVNKLIDTDDLQIIKLQVSTDNKLTVLNN